MRLNSTDLSSLTAITVGAVIGVGMTGLLVGTGVRVEHEHQTVTVEHLRAVEPGSRVHHDFERPDRSGARPLLRLRETSTGERPVLERSTAPIGSPLIYVDGVRVDAMPDLGRDAIDRIEVVKGSSALELFGPEAVHGVIQIFTKPATAPNPGR